MRVKSLELVVGGGPKIGVVDTSLASGLVAYWNFNEDTGTTLYDDTGNGNNGTFNGTTGSQWVTGKIGYGLHFDGSTNYVNLGDTSALQLSSAISMAAWVKTGSTASQIIIRKTNSYQLAINNADGSSPVPGSVEVLIGTGSGWGIAGPYWVATTTSIADNNWHYVVGIFNKSTTTINIYVDGPLQATDSSATVSFGSNSNTVYIGEAADYNAAPFSGTIDEVGIWNVALTSTQISTLYNSGAGNAYNATVCPTVVVGASGFSN